MSKKNKKSTVELSSGLASLKDETKHAITAVIFLVLGIFFLLAGFSYAGRGGRFVYELLDNLFGAGYFLIPVILIILSISFLKAIKPHFFIHRMIGGLFFFLSGLGLLSTVVATETGGLLGKLIATPLIALFDLYISVIFLMAIILISLLILFDTKLSFGFLGLKKLFPRKDRADQENSPEILIKNNGEYEQNSADQNQPQEKGLEAETDKKNAPTSTGHETTGLASFIPFIRKTSYEKFVPPPLSLLEKDSGKPGAGDIKANSNIIKRTLANFGINVEMDEVSIGPSITRYAFKPAEGVKLSKIIGLQNDLALALAAHPIRIEAPIPGKSLVGIEIPNNIKATVGLASLIGSKEFSLNPNPLLVTLGRVISGSPYFTNIAKAPHVLIAGATGSGKSVTIHTLITSLLYRNPPDRLRFIMIDPKRVELTSYNKIPHLLTPVITDAKKAILALKWAAKEMERRYNILEKQAVRDIGSYHQNILEPTLVKLANNEIGQDDELERMPYIVIIIDELADIMSTYPRELEAAIVRLAQMSRAVGIHLILSTQRPSVEIITGLIKANIPARIALQVSSQIDSRTIIDTGGAEKLLGSGDMLYISGEMSKPIRIQSGFISETEVKKVVEYLAKQYSDEVPDEINLEIDNRENTLFGTALDSGDDELYEEAYGAVIEAGKASASYLQRKLKVGYARAARLLDMLEERGVIGPGDGAKPREVFGHDQSTINSEER